MIWTITVEIGACSKAAAATAGLSGEAVAGLLGADIGVIERCALPGRRGWLLQRGHRLPRSSPVKARTTATKSSRLSHGII